MTADERLALVQLKIDRATEHINSLKNAVRVFFDSKPYKVSTKRDPQTRKLTYFVSDVKPSPPSFATITGDAIQNLRSALDHLAYQLFLVGTNAATSGRHIYFPIASGAEEYARKSPRRLQGMRQDAKDLLNRIEPYKDGKGHKYWELQELNNIDKHRLLVTVGSRFRSLNIGPVMQSLWQKGFSSADIPVPKIPDIFLLPADDLCPLKVGDELYTSGVDDEEIKEAIFKFDIGLSEPEVIKGGPLLETLNDLSNLVSNTVTLFKPCLT